MRHGNSNPLIIIGCGGLGREVASLMMGSDWDLIGFIDDNQQGFTIEGYPILGTVKSLLEMNTVPQVAIAIADPCTRRRIFLKLSEAGIKIATLVHPNSIISPFVSIGEGSIVCNNTTLTTNVTLGKCCIVNPGCFIGHDTIIGNWSSLMPHSKIAGEVVVGEGSYFGINSAVINRTTVGEWSVVGAGATVTKKIPSFSLAVGVPAKVIKRLDNIICD